MNDYQIAALAIFAMAVLCLVIYVPRMRREAKAEAFDAHAADVLAAHKADVRHQGHVANATGTGWVD